MKTITLEISSCRDCPHVKFGSSYSLDGWDRGEDWHCTKTENKKIATFVEFNENPGIPNWCPLDTKSDTHEKKKKVSGPKAGKKVRSQVKG